MTNAEDPKWVQECYRFWAGQMALPQGKRVKSRKITEWNYEQAKLMMRRLGLEAS